MRDIKDVTPEELLELPPGELHIVEGARMSGKSRLACKLIMTFLKNRPNRRIAIVAQEETPQEITQRCASLVATDPAFADLTKLDGAVFIPGTDRVPPKHQGRNRSKQTLNFLSEVDVIIYDTLYMDDEIPEFVEMFPNASHIGIFQKPRRPQKD